LADSNGSLASGGEEADHEIASIEDISVFS
jgi:hypothetical protein